MRTLLLSLLATCAFADLVTDVKVALSQNQLPMAQQMVDAYKKQRGTTPEMIEATSWLVRAGRRSG